MRTTLTLDDALARRLEERATATGRTFQQVANEALARGLAAEEVRVNEPYRLEPVSLGGAREGVDLVKAASLAASLDLWERRRT